MGYVMAYGACCGCGKTFGFHPNFVPSIKLTQGKPDPNGTREPVCQSCVERGNRLRIEAGLEEIKVNPLAYEPAEENAVDWDS